MDRYHPLELNKKLEELKHHSYWEGFWTGLAIFIIFQIGIIIGWNYVK